MKFVHLERAPEKWHKTVVKWMQRWPKKECAYSAAMRVHPKKVTSSEFLAGYHEHNKRIREIFKDQPDRLLILNIEEGNSTESMQKFCDFVGIDKTKHEACNKPFPHQNSNKNSKKAESLLQSDMSTSDIDWDWIDADDDAEEAWGPEFDEGYGKPVSFQVQSGAEHCTSKQPGGDQHKPVGAAKGGKMHYTHDG